MTKQAKPNPTPHAPFNLRITGPMKPTDIVKRLGQGFRMAMRPGDQRATVDMDPCPHCNMPVEWAATSTTEHGKTVQYVYARCQGKQRHSWGFSNKAVHRDRVEHVITDLSKVVAPAPRPSAGSAAMTAWIERKANELHAQVLALEELKRLAMIVSEGVPPPRMSPQLPVPPNGDPTPSQR